MNTISIVTPQNIELEYDLGSLGDRIVGRILDWLVLFAYVILVIVAIGFSRLEGFFSSFPWAAVFLMIPVVFYDLASELLLNGQSVGKKVMGIKVVSLNGEQPNLSQYLIRWVFRIVDFTLTSGIIALILVAVTQKKQRLGDILAGTVLVKTKPRTYFSETFYAPATGNYQVSYPEVIHLKDQDVQLIKEILNNVNRSGNYELAQQAQQKVETVLNIRSRHFEPKEFLVAVISDYNHLTSQL